MTIILILAGVLSVSLIIIGILLNTGLKRDKDDDFEQYTDLYKNLMSKSLGNKNLIRRLIAHERSMDARASTRRLMERAIAKWERDNR